MAKRICDFEDFLPAALYWDANFIVNFGNASAGDIIRLIEAIREKVHQKTGLTLELEIRIIGEN